MQIQHVQMSNIGIDEFVDILLDNLLQWPQMPEIPNHIQESQYFLDNIKLKQVYKSLSK